MVKFNPVKKEKKKQCREGENEFSTVQVGERLLNAKNKIIYFEVHRRQKFD